MKKLSLILLLILLLSISWVPVKRPRVLHYTAPDAHNLSLVADSAYYMQDYFAAARYYARLDSLSGSKLDTRNRFKYAYSLLRENKFNASNAQFTQLHQEAGPYLSRYSQYFKIKNTWQIQPQIAAKLSEVYIKKHNRHALADSLLIPLADYYYKQEIFDKSRSFYLKHKKERVDKHRRAYVSIQAALSLYHNNKRKMAREEFVQILRKYPSKKEALTFVEWLQASEPDLFSKHFFSCINVYYRNGKYKPAKKLLEEYIKDQQDQALKENARYHLIKLYFAKKQYSTALYGFKNMLKHLQNKKLEPKIRLYIARIYLAKGQKRNAVKGYLDYAKRFPRRRIAPEAVWKAAWIREELKDLAGASELYKMVRKKWPRNKLARESYFREGFTLFRLNRIPEAEAIFKTIHKKRWPDVDKNRARFWQALCRDIDRDYESARKMRFKLAQQLWDDYYTMKSYLMHKADFDSAIGVVAKFDDSSERLNYKANLKLNRKFEEAFEVKHILGEKYAFAALEDIKLSVSTQDEWIALAEIYKKLKAYGKAFKTYDFINRKFFSDKPFMEKAFILKERFPYYYDSYVLKHAQNTNIEPELILALMKQESTFDFNAHSWANAYGLMQLLPATAKEMAALKKVRLTENEQLFDPELNIGLGTQYLKQLSKRFKGRKEWVLAAYNAGPHRVKRWRKLPGSEQIDVFIENVEYSQTRDYVRKVMKNYWAYKLLQNNFQVESNHLLGQK